MFQLGKTIVSEEIIENDFVCNLSACKGACCVDGGLEEAYNQGATKWKKPVSCHLYPIRVREYSELTAVNYHKWEICDPACSLGNELKVPIYKFVKEALIRKFGKKWYSELEQIALEHTNG